MHPISNFKQRQKKISLQRLSSESKKKNFSPLKGLKVEELLINYFPDFFAFEAYKSLFINMVILMRQDS